TLMATATSTTAWSLVGGAKERGRGRRPWPERPNAARVALSIGEVGCCLHRGATSARLRGFPSLRFCGRRTHEANVIAVMVTVTTMIHAPSLRATWETSAPIMLKKIPA